MNRRERERERKSEGERESERERKFAPTTTDNPKTTTKIAAMQKETGLRAEHEPIKSIPIAQHSLDNMQRSLCVTTFELSICKCICIYAIFNRF